MLIKCPECGKDVSDKAAICMNCGFPIGEVDLRPNKNICVIDGVPCDLTVLLENVDNGDYRPGIYLKEHCGLGSGGHVWTLWDRIKLTRQIPKEYNSDRRLQFEAETERLRGGSGGGRSTGVCCPSCKSTDVKRLDAIDRTISVGLMGLGSKKIGKSFECRHCGYTW